MDRYCSPSCQDFSFSQWYQQEADKIFTGLIEDEKKPEEKLKTEVVKAFSDGCEGSKSAGINKEGKDEDLENRPEKKLKIDDLDSDFVSDPDSDCDFSYLDGPMTLDYCLRNNRVELVQRFTDHYKFEIGEKICVHPYGQPILCFSDNCSESTWVGVHGMHSICMVIRRDMDMTRLPAFYQKDCMKDNNMRLFARAAISEVECLPHNDVNYYDDAFRRSCTGIVKKPFAVVSLGTLEKSGSQGSKPPQCFADRTIDFLNYAVRSGCLDTHYGVIRVAIKGYKLMCHKELRADDIWVTIMNLKSDVFDHLPIDLIGEQLDFVNRLNLKEDWEQLVHGNGLSSENENGPQIIKV